MHVPGYIIMIGRRGGGGCGGIKKSDAISTRIWNYLILCSLSFSSIPLSSCFTGGGGSGGGLKTLQLQT